MSVTTSTDPVVAVIDMLESVADTAWPNDEPPTRIEKMEASDPSDKERDQRRAQVSIYIGQLTDGDIQKQSPDGSVDGTYVVTTQVWHGDSDTSHTYQRAVFDILSTFATDNIDRTPYYEIWPQADTDNRAQAFNYGSFAVKTVRTRLQEYRDPPSL